MRLDKFLVDNNYFPTRQKAQYSIENRLVLVNKKIVTKVSLDVKDDDEIEILKPTETLYVSRAGHKLEKALKYFQIDVKNKTCLDIGSSTGGFSHCLLNNDAKLIYATDVGTSQLDPILRSNDKIKSIENLNFREAKNTDFDSILFDIVTIDVSFISLKHIFDNLNNFITSDSIVVALIKPQFELYDESNKGKGKITKEKDHMKAINNVIDYAKQNKIYLNGLTFSPIIGNKKGNIEYLGLFSKQISKKQINIEEIVHEAHLVLK